MKFIVVVNLLLFFLCVYGAPFKDLPKILPPDGCQYIIQEWNQFEQEFYNMREIYKMANDEFAEDEDKERFKRYELQLENKGIKFYSSFMEKEILIPDFLINPIPDGYDCGTVDRAFNTSHERLSRDDKVFLYSNFTILNFASEAKKKSLINFEENITLSIMLYVK